MRPLGDRVIVRRIEENEKSGLIELPDNAKEKPMEAEVISVGRGRYNDATGKRIPVDVKRGDKVLFGKYSGVEIKVKGEELLILREDELLAQI